jgi:hypothetical protein
VSPTLIQNIITNTSFKNKSGWTGTTKTANGKFATVENVYGRFKEGTFVPAIEELSNINENYDGLPYMKLVFADGNSVVMNSGPYDNRSSIGNIEEGEKWYLKIEALNSKGEIITKGLSASLGEYIYDPTGKYYK